MKYVFTGENFAWPAGLANSWHRPQQLTPFWCWPVNSPPLFTNPWKGSSYHLYIIVIKIVNGKKSLFVKNIKNLQMRPYCRCQSVGRAVWVGFESWQMGHRTKVQQSHGSQRTAGQDSALECAFRHNQPSRLVTCSHLALAQTFSSHRTCKSSPIRDANECRFPLELFFISLNNFHFFLSENGEIERGKTIPNFYLITFSF